MSYALTYGAENRHTSFTGGSVTATLAYDGDGNRVLGTIRSWRTPTPGGCPALTPPLARQRATRATRTTLLEICQGPICKFMPNAPWRREPGEGHGVPFALPTPQQYNALHSRWTCSTCCARWNSSTA